MRRHIFYLVTLLLASEVAMGQDDHYWSQQFGAVSTSMGGAVVGGVRDNSAIFYNPGAQAFIDNTNLSVDADLYRMDRIIMRDGGGEGVDLNALDYSIFPQIIAGMINLVHVPKLNFSYAIMTRNHTYLAINSRFTSRDLKVNPNPNSEFIGAFDYSNQMDEQWLGLNASYKLNEKNGIGISLFGSYRWQTYSATDYIREISYQDSSAWFNTFNIDEYVDYYMIQFLAKLGWAYESGKWRIGVSATTPALRISGSGEIHREVSLYSASDQPEDTSFSFLILDRQSDIRTIYRYPFSIAAGLEYHTSKTRLSITAEYFTGIKAYDLIHTSSDPLVYPPWIEDSASAQQYLGSFLNVRNQAKPVLNIALGFSQNLSQKITLMAGARTDFSSYKKTENATILMHDSGDWDLYNISGGLSYHGKKQSVTLGLSYTFSPKKSIDPYAVVNPLSPSGLQSTVFAQSFALVLGYTHYIN